MVPDRIARLPPQPEKHFLHGVPPSSKRWSTTASIDCPNVLSIGIFASRPYERTELDDYGLGGALLETTQFHEPPNTNVRPELWPSKIFGFVFEVEVQTLAGT